MQTDSKVVLFEQTPIPKAVAQLAVPTVLSSLVMVIYNLADTFFVGMLNDPVQNAAVTLQPLFCLLLTPSTICLVLAARA